MTEAFHNSSATKNEPHIPSDRLAGKTSAEAYLLAGATTVAQMRQALTQLLPVIGAGLVCVANHLEE